MKKPRSLVHDYQLPQYPALLLESALMRKEIGRIIRQARKAKGLKQNALAVQLGHKYASNLADIERGDQIPSFDIAQKLEKELNLPPHSLLSLVLKYRLDQAAAIVIEEAQQRGLNIRVGISFHR